MEDPAALEQEWRDAGRLHLIRTGLLRQKAIEDLMENANVTEVGRPPTKRGGETRPFEIVPAGKLLGGLFGLVLLRGKRGIYGHRTREQRPHPLRH